MPTRARTLFAVIGLPLSVIAIIGFVLFAIFGSFRSSPVYTRALAAAQADARVRAALGDPIQAGWLVAGSLSEQGISGDADLVIPISGPLKGGTLYASARKGNGEWQFYTLAVQVDGENRLIVLEP